MRYQCPCCSYLTYPVSPQHDCGYICPVCFWENDPFIDTDNEPSDSNHGMTLLEGQVNYKRYGACDKELLGFVRRPRTDEVAE